MDNAEKTLNDAPQLKPYRFTSTNQPKHNGRPKGTSATDWLRKLSRTKIDFLNPLTGLKDNATVNEVVAIQLILKATQDSDLPSIREYLDRLDGKVPQKLQGEGFIPETKIFIQNIIHKAGVDGHQREINPSCSESQNRPN